MTTATPTQAELEIIAPVLSFAAAGGAPGVAARPHAMLLQDASLPVASRQRFTFVYQMEFSNTTAFTEEVRQLSVTATKNTSAGNFAAAGVITLIKQPNPYMLDGPTAWLSTDVRVFQIAQNQVRFGRTIGVDAAAAVQFVYDVVTDFNTLAPAAHPFESIATDAGVSQLELSRSVGGQRVFNFAIARVRYRGAVLPATDVRVFFRLFQTATTGLDFNNLTTYRTNRISGPPIALLGLQGGRVASVPCFGTARLDSATAALTDQTDPLNVRTLAAAGGAEQFAYFGCWLDFNQTEPAFPLHPSPDDGPWPSGRLSIQELIRGMHQCLVAEVYFEGDLIAGGATPAGSDNLAQRNLVIAESDNPGSAATHTVQHTFEIKANPFAAQPPPLAVLAEQAARGADNDVRLGNVSRPAGPDEIMIRWNNLPRDSTVTLYMPDVDADDILRFAGQNYESPRIERVDAHTIRCLPADVTFVPLPFARHNNIAALLTIELPGNVRRDQHFGASIHQISGRPRRVLGAFTLAIPVGAASALKAPEIRKLSVLRHIARAIPPDDQWRHVFDRYTAQIAERVDGFGGRSEEVAASPDGDGDSITARCARLQLAYALLLALAVALAAWLPPAGLAAAGVALVLALFVLLMWRRQCRLTRCAWLVTTMAGLSLGAGAAVAMGWFGVGANAAHVLSAVALALGALAVLGGFVWRCFRLPHS